MPAHDHTVHSIHFDKLKCMRSCTIGFDGKRVTGLFGPNGNGKSTVLHALAAIFKPASDKGENHRFTHFFKTDKYFNYNGTQYTVEYSFVDGGAPVTRLSHTFKKTAGRWMRNYDRRPARDVFYIGISTCTPDIEKVRDTLTTIYLHSESSIDDKVAKAASIIMMNRQYASLKSCNEASNKNNQLIVARDAAGEVRSSLSLGAGEQRIMRILRVLYAAPKFSLILIDELDLTLHTAALNRLLDTIHDIADSNRLQVVFTSHREELLKRNDINVRHIYQVKDRTLVFDRTTPECIDRLSGNIQRPLSVFVEDDYAQTVVEEVARRLNIVKRVQVYRIGAITNAMQAAVGLTLQGDSLENVLFVTDGDKECTEAERRKRLDKIFSGTEDGHDAKAQNILDHIKQFTLPADTAPEKFVHSVLCASASDNEVVNSARAVLVEPDSHLYVNRIIDELGYSREVGLTRVVSEFSRSTVEWDAYVREINDWLSCRKAALGM